MENTSANRPIRSRLRQAARCAGSKTQQPALGTTGISTDGFLRQCFTPMYETGTEMPKRSETEGDFFKSLSILKKHYSLDMIAYRKLPYPFNILMTGQELDAKLKDENRFRELLIIKDGDKTTITVRESLRREFSLYYIPVLPVYKMWQIPEQQSCAELLTAVFAYLYIEAGLSYYRDEDTYMFYNYEILADWVEDDKDSADEEDYQKQKKAVETANLVGDFVQQKMMAEGFRHSLDTLIDNFRAVTDFETQSLAIAKNTWRIWQTYPDATLYSHASNPCDLDDEDADDYYYADNNYVGMNEHIGFVASVTDVLSDSLFRMVNDDFNERPSFQEPEITTRFGEKLPQYTDQLACEDQLLELITDLCSLFYKQP